MITQEELKEYLHYDPLTGDFNWTIGKRGLKVNSKAGSMNDQGYVIIRINNIRYRAHRLAWLYVYGHFPINEIDHINGVRSDNRIENLRDAIAARKNAETNFNFHINHGRKNSHESKT